MRLLEVAAAALPVTLTVAAAVGNRLLSELLVLLLPALVLLPLALPPSVLLDGLLVLSSAGWGQPLLPLSQVLPAGPQLKELLPLGAPCVLLLVLPPLLLLLLLLLVPDAQVQLSALLHQPESAGGRLKRRQQTGLDQQGGAPP